MIRKELNCVFIVPTGIGAAIGGHAGDATPAARLIASVCDNLIVHPNVVNASDINEMTDNMLYVEGSALDRFLSGDVRLKTEPSNKILVVVNAPACNETVNAVSAARATLGIDASMLVLNTPLRLVATVEDGSAGGQVFGWRELVEQVREYSFDALAVTTPIEVDRGTALDYLDNGGINPWGGVEAVASKLIAGALNKPVAHAPFGSTVEDYDKIVDPRLAAEMVSVCYLYCVLKGLHKAPRIVFDGGDMSVHDISCLISPAGCFGAPHRSCVDRGIPVMAVRENATSAGGAASERFVEVDNYLEAAGMLVAMKEGISPQSVRRPLSKTEVLAP